MANSLNGTTGTNYVNVAKVLGAGPGIKVTGPDGSQTIPTNQGGITLSAVGTFLSPGAYTVAGTGGTGAASFSAPYTIPTPPTLTSPASGANIAVTRASGVTFTWSGGAANYILQITGNSATDDTQTNGATFACAVAAGANTFTIPASVLLALPPGNFGGMDFQPVSPYGTFPASGLNLSFIQMRYETGILTTFK